MPYFDLNNICFYAPNRDKNRELINRYNISYVIVFYLKTPDRVPRDTVLGEVPGVFNPGYVVRRTASDKILIDILIVSGRKGI